MVGFARLALAVALASGIGAAETCLLGHMLTLDAVTMADRLTESLSSV